MDTHMGIEGSATAKGFVRASGPLDGTHISRRGALKLLGGTALGLRRERWNSDPHQPFLS